MPDDFLVRAALAGLGLTLATGPQDCRFTIKSGGTDEVGFMCCNVEMEEVAETVVVMPPGPG